MDIKTINSRNKEVKSYSEKGWIWDDWDWHSPSYKFKYLSRKGNTLKFEVWKKGMKQVSSGCGSFVSVGYTSGSWKCNGTVTVKIPMEYIEKAENYESLMRSGVSSKLRFNVGKRFTYKG